MAPILVYANFTKPFKLHTDTCGTGLGLSSIKLGRMAPKTVIAYASRSLSKAEFPLPSTQVGVPHPQVGSGREIP